MPETEVIGTDLDTVLQVNRARHLPICDVVIHLAGVNRPQKEEEFEAGNVGSSSAVLAAIGIQS